MPIPSIRPPPPPPRRVPPTANLVQEVSVATYVATHLQMKLSGVAVTSQQLIQTKDAVNDIKVALATAESTMQRITTNPALLGVSPGDSARGGVDIQSLEFAAATRGKLTEQEAKQDAHYAGLREYDSVGQEVRRASKDPSLLRYREEAECQLASSAFPGARFPRTQGGGAGAAAARPIPSEERQALLNPFTTVRRQSKSSALTTSGVFHSSSNSNSSVCTTAFHPSSSNSAKSNANNNYGTNAGAATAPPDAQINTSHASHTVLPLYGQPNGTTSGAAANGGGAGGVHVASAPPATSVDTRYRPSASPSMPPPQPYGGYPATVTPASMAGGYPSANAGGYYGASPYPPQQAQPRPVYGAYGQQQQQPPTVRPTYTAL